MRYFYSYKMSKDVKTTSSEKKKIKSENLQKYNKYEHLIILK